MALLQDLSASIQFSRKPGPSKMAKSVAPSQSSGFLQGIMNPKVGPILTQGLLALDPMAKAGCKQLVREMAG